MADDSRVAKADVVLVGAGIMSATLGALLRLVEPNWSMTLVERLDGAAAESSGPWHNAGTGHAGLCELNYTPQRRDGSIDIARAVTINEQFQLSRQFWAYAVERGLLTDVRGFLNPVPHVGFVRGAAHVDYLQRRHAALAGNPLFAGTELIVGADEFARRLPLMAAQRNLSEPVALDWAPDGTDVNFGNLTGQLIDFGVQSGTEALFGHEVRGLRRESDATWTVCAINRFGARRKINARFVFVGAGGYAVPLLQTAGIPEVKGYGGFPIGGMFLRTDKRALTAGHRAKVYGLPAPGAPGMSAAHLDARIIDGKSWLLFGPYAGWSPKFLKHGHITDLAASIRPNNLPSMLGVGLTELGMVRYLVGQLLLSGADRMAALREFVPSAKDSEWETIEAGQRVQIIRPHRGKGGALEFGTTVLCTADGSIAGLLGASPGASTAVSAMLDVMQRCFPNRYPSWLPKLSAMMPSLGTRLSDEPRLFREVWQWGTKVLGLDTAVGA